MGTHSLDATAYLILSLNPLMRQDGTLSKASRAKSMSSFCDGSRGTALVLALRMVERANSFANC